MRKVFICICALIMINMAACKSTDKNDTPEESSSPSPVYSEPIIETPYINPPPTNEVKEVKLTALSELIVTEEEGKYRNVPDKVTDSKDAEKLKITVNIEDKEETLDFTVTYEKGLIYPVYTGNRSSCSMIIRIGETNSFVIEREQPYNMLYILDFDTGNMKTFLNETFGGYTRQELTELYGSIIWARNPRVSPDGKLVLFETNRYGYRNDIYCHNLETGEETVVAPDYGMGQNPVVWTGRDSFCFNYFYKLYEVSLSAPGEVKYIGSDNLSFASWYPYIIYQNNDSIILYNLDTDSKTYYGIYNYPQLSINGSNEHPVVIALHRDERVMRLTLFLLEKGKAIDILELEAAGHGSISWLDTETIILYGSFNRVEKTYYINVSSLMKATEDELEDIKEEASDLFKEIKVEPVIDETPTPAETYKPYRDDDSECEVIYNDKKFIVNGVYTDEELSAIFGITVSDTIETVVAGDVPRRYHNRTIKYDGITVKAYQTAGYPPDSYREYWSVTSVFITNSKYSTPAGARVGMTFDEVYNIYRDNKGYRLGYDVIKEGGVIGLSSDRSIYTTYDYEIRINLSNNIVNSIELYYISPG